MKFRMLAKVGLIMLLSILMLIITENATVAVFARLLIKFSLIALLTVSLRFIELCRAVINNTELNKILPNIRVSYDLLYLHLPMSMASMGLVCDRLIGVQREGGSFYAILLIIILCTVAGCISRGIISRGEPEVSKHYDRDWMCGIIVPNSCGIASLVLSISLIVWV